MYVTEDEPKAGALGVFYVFFFGVGYILIAFAAAYMWTDGVVRVAAAIAVASIIIPVTVGYLVAELRNQRAGAFWFVLTAAVLAGALAAWSYQERDNFNERQEVFAPAEPSE